MNKYIAITISILLVSWSFAADLNESKVKEMDLVRCGNLVYAGNQSSVCFATKFLSKLKQNTSIKASTRLKDVRLTDPNLYQTPFIIFSGEGNFKVSSDETNGFADYLKEGGFVLASPSCSDPKWDKAFRNFLKSSLPDIKLEEISMNHPIFSLVYEVKSLHLSTGGTTKLEGLFVDDRLALVYSKDGLNDIKNAKGCCCCGGNEIKESQQMNVNIFTYALVY
ncbi:MAG: DUF4159 domain-containing protein [Lentisphaeria bacterium]|nr:DUF4159 domain-containing protein [Lentisphaeria bacterium]